MSRHDINKSVMKEIKQNLDSYAFTGLVSESLGIGTADDKLTSFNDFSFKRIQAPIARRMYASSDILQNIIDVPALDATREGFTLKSDYDSEGASDMMLERLEELDISDALRQHLQNTDLYSRGSLFLPVLTETFNYKPEEKISINTIERVEALNVLTEDDFSFQFAITNAFSKDYQRPSQTFIQGMPTDKSRFCWNSYKFFPRENEGVSLLHKVLLACLALRVTNWSLANVMLEVQNKVLKVEDLDSYQFQGEGRPDFRGVNGEKRQGVIDTVKRWFTSSKMIVIDKNDDYTRNMYQATGTKDATDFFWEYLAAVTGYPQATIKGQAMGTISAADTDSRRYVQFVRTNKQFKICKPILKHVINLLKYERSGAFFRKFGMRAYDINFEIDFKPIWKANEAEEADIKLKNSQRGQIDITTGVRGPDQVQKELYPELAEDALPVIPETGGEDILQKQREQNQIVTSGQQNN